MKKILTGIAAGGGRRAAAPAVIGALTLITLALAGCMSAPARTGGGMELDAAIQEAAAQMEARIPQGTMIALVSVASPSTAFSSQALTMLESTLVSSGKLVVVDRANLDKVRAEQGFQLSGEVDDESAKSIGKLLGAGAIVTGGLADVGDAYSLTLKAINMETATVAVSYMADLAKTARIETLLAAGGGAGGSAGGTAAAASPAQAVPAQTGPKNGTYTFYPRLRPYQGASVPAGVYLYNLVVRGGYMNIYLCRDEAGALRAPHGDWLSNSNVARNYILQDLDNPALSYAVEGGTAWAGAGYSSDDTERWMTFKVTKGTRFSLTNKIGNTPSVFEEIVLNEPDAE
jgi:hypothetical protein